ncbi:hypothetical protein [Tenacibaculum mesophilum]|uniref:hypothetical protein n=1 Tax=Tenacibaculum mesophilum TaxID=104268 RepID=UPI0012E53E37|nr:hypothetical protein [Tenacibaculum mesophilum]BFF36767.1 hypothetical protein BACT7_16290 [Tenacibaculum mesophilum]GFD73597.1 hypothetical protein KUL113_30170 [Tenacibaculum sp. KUL113]
MPRVKSFNEEEVLAKAMCLFWKQGYLATSVQDLVCHLYQTLLRITCSYRDKKTYS